MKKRDAIKHFGSVQALADAVGVTHGAVSQWGEHIPHLRAYQIECITKGALKARVVQQANGGYCERGNADSQ